jgi:hypothetical protein
MLLKLYKLVPKENLQTVSAGAGNGSRELILNPQTICIDPDPFSFQTKTQDEKQMILPQYKTVDDFMKSNDMKQHKGPRCLCLFHPSPTDPNYPEADYDYEAIQLLKPDYILIMACRENSGSNALWCWLENEYQLRSKQRYQIVCHETEHVKTIDKQLLLMEYFLVCKKVPNILSCSK